MCMRDICKITVCVMVVVVDALIDRAVYALGNSVAQSKLYLKRNNAVSALCLFKILRNSCCYALHCQVFLNLY